MENASAGSQNDYMLHRKYSFIKRHGRDVARVHQWRHQWMKPHAPGAQGVAGGGIVTWRSKVFRTVGEDSMSHEAEPSAEPSAEA